VGEDARREMRGVRMERRVGGGRVMGKRGGGEEDGIGGVKRGRERKWENRGNGRMRVEVVMGGKG